MMKGRHSRAFNSLARLRWTKVQAARDLFYMHTLLEAEKALEGVQKNKIIEIFTVGRNRRAMVGSQIVMFMQQVNSSHRMLMRWANKIIITSFAVLTLLPIIPRLSL